MQCVDIETDFNSFYLKFAVDCQEYDDKTDLKDIKFESYKVFHYWRQKISMSTAKKH